VQGIVYSLCARVAFSRVSFLGSGGANRPDGVGKGGQGGSGGGVVGVRR